MLPTLCKTIFYSLTSLLLRLWPSQLVSSFKPHTKSKMPMLLESSQSLVYSMSRSHKSETLDARFCLEENVNVLQSVSSLSLIPHSSCLMSQHLVSIHSKPAQSVSYFTILPERRVEPSFQRFTSLALRRSSTSTAWSWWLTGSRCSRATQASRWSTSERWSSTCQRGATPPTSLWRRSTSSTPSSRTT